MQKLDASGHPHSRRALCSKGIGLSLIPNDRACLQCLSHTDVLTHYFLRTNVWREDLNQNNVLGAYALAPCPTPGCFWCTSGCGVDEGHSHRPLLHLPGSGGKVACAYAELLGKLWAGNKASISPAEFKRTIGEFAPQFAGYRQHDAQVRAGARQEGGIA